MTAVLKGTLSRQRMRQFLELKLEKFSLNVSSLSVNFKMASTSGGGHGGKRMNSERRRIFENTGTEKDI